MAEGFRSPIDRPAVDVAPAVRLSDESQLAKWRIWEDVHGVAIGRAGRHAESLVLAVSPGEWIVIGEPPAGIEAVDLTHVRAALRLTGSAARQVLAKVCALDLSDVMTPDGASARTLVAGIATEIARDDLGREPSYLLLVSRSFARSLWDRLVAAAEA